MTGPAAGLTERAGGLFDEPGGVGIAVSGGGDSMALLDLAIRAAAIRDRPVAAVTVDHGLRSGSAAEAAAVAAHCRARGIAHDTLSWRWDGRGNLPGRARAARYRLIGGWAAANGIARVGLAHTRDDVAEGVLIRLRRAPGVDGLAAMPERFRREGVAWRRPLLDVARADLRAHLRAAGIAWAEDPTNDDPAYDRARARSILGALAPVGVGADSLAATARNLAQAKAALDLFTAREAARVVREDRGDLLIDRAPDPPLATEIDRRLLLAALAWIAGPAARPRQSALARLARGMEAGSVRVLAGARISAEGGVWRIGREAAAVRGVAGPTRALWDGRWRLEGPHAPDLHVAALGAGLRLCPDWRDTGLPRAALAAGPAIWRGDDLVAAPLAGRPEGWQARPDGRGNFAAFCLRD